MQKRSSVLYQKKLNVQKESTQARRNEKNSRGLGVYQKMLANLVSWLRRLLNWNCLKYPEIIDRVEVGNGNSQHKQMFVKHLCRVSS